MLTPIIRALVQAGATPEMILAAVEAHEAEQNQAVEARREKDRERKRASRSVRNVTRNPEDSADGADIPPPPDKKAPHTPKELTPSPSKKTPKGVQKGSPPPSEAIEIWNEVCGAAGLPTVRKLPDARKARIAARLADDGIDGWQGACQRVARSKFCLGENDRHWRADIDFLSTESGFAKVMEGKYDNHDARPAAKPSLPALPPLELTDSAEHRFLRKALDAGVSEYTVRAFVNDQSLKAFYHEGQAYITVASLRQVFEDGFGELMKKLNIRYISPQQAERILGSGTKQDASAQS